MSLASGTRVGAYDVLAPLGEGGMGQVFRARDMRLGRDVALKTLPAAFTNDPDRLARFRREAQVLATLNHPHIGGIYGFEETDGHCFLVLELVEGDTLAARIRRGPLPVDDALAVARQIAEALEAAHEKGIVHRDLKPANIALTEHDAVKVLDFGLAKAVEPSGGPSASDPLNSPTITSPVTLTALGVILGTAAYMSPEQAKGRPADKRSDVWAFGCVLYEMLSGRRAFKGEDVPDTLAAVLRGEPDWKALPPSLPPAIRALLEGCLRKNPRERISDISAARFALQLPSSAPATGVAPGHGRPRWTWMVVPILAAVAGTAVALWPRAAASPAPVTRLAITFPEGRHLTVSRQSVAVSPDGRRIVYSADGRLYLHDLSDFESREIPGANPAIQAAFSPDGESLVFWAATFLQRIPVTGGVPVNVCVTGAAPFGISWGDAGIVYALPGTGIFRVAANGGHPTLVVPLKPADGLGASPQFLPDGETILFSLGPTLSVTSAYWDKARVVVHSLKTGQRKTVIEGGSSARYLRAGYIVYMLEGTMMAVPFDAAALETTGPAVPVVAGIRRAAGSAGGGAHLGISDAGTLAYAPGPSRAGDEDVFLYDRSGDKAEPLGLPRGTYGVPRVSRDGKTLAVETSDGREAVVSIFDLAARKTALRRLTFGGNNRLPIWTADGKRLAFQSDREGDLAIFWQPLDGGPAERLTRPETGVAHVPEAWSPTADLFLFSAMKGSAAALWWYSLPDRKARPVPGATSSAFPTNAVFSPDGRWIAYQAGDEYSGEATSYVEPFPPTGQKFEMARGGRALWSRDGKEIFFVPGPSQFASVEVQTTPALAFRPPMQVPRRFGLAPPASPRPYDMTTDGRFVAVDVAGEGREQRPLAIHVVLNWLEELKAKVKNN